jgi:hypothetical protein
MLKYERGFGSALPETREQHREHACLSYQEHGPDAWLGQHMRSGAGREKGSAPAQKSE